MNWKNPLVKATSALALALLLLIGTGAGSIYGYKRWDAEKRKTEIALIQGKVAEATKEAAKHEQRANDIAQQRDAAQKVAATANARAATSNKKLNDLMNQPKPADLTEELVLTQEQRDAAIVALLDEQAAHARDNEQKDLFQAENKELRLEVGELKTGLTNQIQLTTKVQVKLEAAEKGRIRWRNTTIGVSLVGGGAALATWLIKR